MVKALRRGDQVITQGGLIGKVSKVKEENELEVELAENVKVRVVQSTIYSSSQQDRASQRQIT